MRDLSLKNLQKISKLINKTCSSITYLHKMNVFNLGMYAAPIASINLVSAIAAGGLVSITASLASRAFYGKKRHSSDVPQKPKRLAHRIHFYCEAIAETSKTCLLFSFARDPRYFIPLNIVAAAAGSRKGLSGICQTSPIRLRCIFKTQHKQNCLILILFLI